MKISSSLFTIVMFLSILTTSKSTFAKSETYQIDPARTYPTLEADHMGGLSLWRGKINSTRGVIIIDRKYQTGTVEVVTNMDSIDFGLEEMNKRARSNDLFDVDKYPESRYSGILIFEDGEPSRVQGDLTLLGVKKAVVLNINHFKCIFHPMRLKRVCGTDASGLINRDEFGIDYGKAFGFKMDVMLRISIEGFRTARRNNT